ncbi:putative bifunctional diguanylate cyclase/phosphodiesterase [Chenggangzhangella methanolivorans]|uniref:putative bifunctional diguanylate cyclase/phosphodiesterase n=1 Tax=Chenggangzhangella methanolivorans TaxID=1437009 RepID=UPI0028F4086E|nr:EAL domain-containing protein [Chenggangzhangella methanolivorans]
MRRDRGRRDRPDVGSCGAAAYRREPVTVVDIATDPLWERYRHLALPLGLQACWSCPILGTQGETLGTFAFYFRTRRGPNEDEEQVVETCVDLCAIAIERHEAEREIHRLAYFDTLTGLGNRASFDIALEALEGTGGAGLLLIDVDRLKIVNDTLGHAAGDDLLREIGRRIGETAPDGAYRISGDEFAVVLRGANVAEAMPWVADRLLEAMQPQALCGGRPHRLAVTVGGAVLGEDGATVESLRQKADIALYHAKDAHRGGFARFTEGLGDAAARRLQAIRDVREALDEDRVEAYFQPIARLDTGDFIGLEALCRVFGRDGARMAEAPFQLAMTDGVAATLLTERMLTQVARAIRSWLDDGVNFQHVGVNVSAGDFHVGALEKRISGVFERYGVPLRHVILEVTELVYLGKKDNLVGEAVKALRARGLLVALDDFGTGYASLTHLVTFPVDIIKIDKSFVADLGEGGPGAAIVGGLIDIARKLGMKIVAEGVETAEQARLLEALGCRLGQGFFYARPGDFDLTTKRLRERGQPLPDAAPARLTAG